MQGLMMDYPLTLTQFFERSRRLFAQKPLATRVPGGPLFRYTYADFAERVTRLAGGLVALGVHPGNRVGNLRVEYPPPPGGVLGHPHDGCRPAHGAFPPCP